MNIAICYDEEMIKRHLDAMGDKHTLMSRLDTYDTAGDLLASDQHYDLILLDGAALQTMRRTRDDVHKTGKKQNAVLLIRTRQQSYVIHKQDILYAENDLKKIVLHMAGETIEYTATMRDLEAQLGDDFYRCHRGFLVNLAHVQEYGSDSILVDNGEEIFLARRKYNEFVTVYTDYLRSR